MAGKRWGYLQSGQSDYNADNDYNFICQRCGFKCKKKKDIRREWTGLWVCTENINGCWEPRNAQDFVRGVPDKQTVLPAQPDPNNSIITYWPYPCVGDIMTAGLSVAGTGFVKSGTTVISGYPEPLPG